MPLWIYVYVPWVTAIYIALSLLINFGFLCVASTCADGKPKAVKFALDRLIIAFICAVVSAITAFAIMGAFLTYGDATLQHNLSVCNYDKSTIWVPILASVVSAFVMYWLTRFAVLGKRVSDKTNRTMLCGCFALLNVPYVVLIPILI